MRQKEKVYASTNPKKKRKERKESTVYCGITGSDITYHLLFLAMVPK